MLTPKANLNSLPLMQTNPPLAQQVICDKPRFAAKRPLKLAKGGFSLIEVVLALGVISFAFVALFGLLPVGLNTFNNSIDSTMEAQIAESVMSQLKQDKFSTLATDFNDTNGGVNSGGLPSFFKQPNTTPYLLPATGFFYDDQGNFLGLVQSSPPSGTVNPISTPPSTWNVIYTAGVQVYYDALSASSSTTTPPFNVSPTSPNGTIVSTSYNSNTPQSMATVVITVRKFSTPNVARIYTGYIENNGL